MVDYLLLSPSIINIITDFEIIDFNPMFSEVHNRVHLTIRYLHWYKVIKNTIYLFTLHVSCQVHSECGLFHLMYYVDHR
jgi:hypothetical protein